MKNVLLTKNQDVSYFLSDLYLIPSLDEKTIHSYIDVKDKLSLTMFLDGTAIGISLISLAAPDAEIDYILIKSVFQNVGNGSFLITNLEKLLFEKYHIENIFLECKKKNSQATRFYEKNGYQLYRVRNNYYEFDDANCYKKVLKNE